MPTRTAQGIAADVAAMASAAGATYSWIAVANDILQLVATAIAIVAGIYAVRWHRFRLTHGRAALDRVQRKQLIAKTIKETQDEDEE